MVHTFGKGRSPLGEQWYRTCKTISGFNLFIAYDMAYHIIDPVVTKGRLGRQT